MSKNELNPLKRNHKRKVISSGEFRKTMTLIQGQNQSKIVISCKFWVALVKFQLAVLK